MQVNSLSAEMLLARFFDTSLLGSYCEKRLGKSAKGSASTLAARIVSAWGKPRQRSNLPSVERPSRVRRTTGGVHYSRGRASSTPTSKVGRSAGRVRGCRSSRRRKACARSRALHRPRTNSSSLRRRRLRALSLAVRTHGLLDREASGEDGTCLTRTMALV